MSASHRRRKKAERYSLRNSLCYIRLTCQASTSSDHCRRRRRRHRVRVTRNSNATKEKAEIDTKRRVLQ